MTDIAARLGVSRERIRQRLQRNGISGTNPNSQLSAAEMLEATGSKTAFADVAESLGVSEGSLRAWVAATGIEVELSARLETNRQATKAARDAAARARIVEIIKHMHAKTGETPRAADLAPHGIYAVTLIRYFGSTPAAMEAAGLRPRKKAWGAGAVVTPSERTNRAGEVASGSTPISRDHEDESGSGNTSPMSWYFRSPAPDEAVRDPVHEEFFADDAIRDVCDALVREGIQNALDAGTDGDEPVVVRLGVRSPSASDALTADAERRAFMTGIYGHWAAKGNGLANAPRKTDSLSWIVFEDFGTRGLTGNPSQSFPEEEPNPFFAFFRAEGYSEKGKAQRGRWGLGKFAFPRSSLGRCFLGLTVRHDDGRRFLMGRCTLKSHRIGEDRFTPDGFFGVRVSNSPVMPYEDAAVLDRFTNAFGLARDDSRAGLSVVVPFVDIGEVKSNSLLSAVLRGYWLAILSGQLVVRLVEEGGNVVEINTETLDAVLEKLPQIERDALLPLVALGRWGLQQPDDANVGIEIPPAGTAPKWSAAVPVEETVDLVRQRLEGGRVKIRVGVSVQQKDGGAAVPSSFDILLEKTGDGRAHKPLFLREGILISDVRITLPNGWRGVVLVEDAPLAALLGDSENPAHTRWLREGTHFKGRYVHGKELITYVTTSVRAIIDRLSAADQQADPTVLADVLSVLLPETSGQQRKPRPTDDNATDTDKPEIDIKGTPRRYRLSQVEGGFAVAGSGIPIAPGTVLQVRVAYDVRTGNAFSVWQEFDFDVGKSPIRIQEQASVDVLERKENKVRFAILADDFRFVLTGFDTWRDLKVDAKLETGGEA